MNGRRLRLLVLGGYGTFGGRVVRLLCTEPSLSLIVAGRSLAKAEAFCRTLAPGAQREAAAVDRDGDLEQAFQALEPDIVIDATGPFQMYGENPYRVVEAAIAAGAHYLDLADGSGFVRGITQFDYEAKVQGLAVLSGVSSFPVLTSAAARLLARDLEHVDAITAGIAPSPFASYGLNVIRAIAGYAGQPVKMRRGGKDGIGRGIAEMRRYAVAPPGHVPLQPTEFALVDVPDLLLLAELWPEVQDIWVGAGPVPVNLQRILRLLAWLVARGWFPSLSPFAKLMFWAVNNIRWGEDRGGMFVELEGRNAAGVRETRSWHMLVEGAGGPWIPSMAVAAIIRKWLAGLVPMPGARPALEELELSDYQPYFARQQIVWGLRRRTAAEVSGPNDVPGGQGLFAQLLGEAFDALPPSLRFVHGESPQLQLHGHASIVRGSALLARFAARVFGLPRAAPKVPVTVTFERTPEGEKWTRDFGGQRFSTTLFAGKGRHERLLCERFGPLTFAMALVVDGDRLQLMMRGWRVFGVPLPRALAPRGSTWEFESNGCFRFHVEIDVPLIGRIVAYEGYLEPDANRHVLDVVLEPVSDYG